MSEVPSPLPASLRIGPYTWHVFNDKKSWKRETKKRPDKEEESDGWTDLKTREIYIRPEQEIQYERVILIHEIMHAARDSSHLESLDLNDAEESFIRHTAPIIYGVLQDNPDLLDYLGLT